MSSRVAATVLALAAAALAQAPQIRMGVTAYAPLSEVIQAQSNLVPVEVVARHEDGSVIAGLTRANFHVFNEGKLEPLSQFSVVVYGAAPAAAPAAQALPGPTAASAAPAPPRFVALWFDDVNTADGDLKHARNAALEFLRHWREPGDRIGVFTTSGTDQVGFTSDAGALATAIAAIRAHPRQSQYGIGSCPRITPFQAYQISVLHYPEAIAAAQAEYEACSGTGSGPGFNVRTGPMIGPAAPPAITSQADATWNLTTTVSENTQDDIRGVLDALATENGKRVLLLASGGFLTETLETRQERLINQALRDKVVINALDARGLYTVDPSQPLSNPSELGVLPLITFFYQQQSNLNAQGSKDDALVEMAQATGGLFFHNNNDLELGFERLGLEPPVTYEMAFVPVSLPHDGKFHQLSVKLAPPVRGAVIQARRGYFDPPKDTPASLLGPALDRAMRDNTQAGAVPVTVTPKPVADGVGVDVRFDIGRMPFVDQHGRRNQTLTVIAGLFAPGGEFVTGKRGVIDLALDGPHYKRFRQQGLGATLRLAAPPGVYRLRVAIGESSDAKLSAFTREVTIH